MESSLHRPNSNVGFEINSKGPLEAFLTPVFYGWRNLWKGTGTDWDYAILQRRVWLRTSRSAVQCASSRAHPLTLVPGSLSSAP